MERRRAARKEKVVDGIVAVGPGLNGVECVPREWRINTIADGARVSDGRQRESMSWRVC